MIEDWMFKLDDDPKIRAQSLADAADSQRRPGAVDTPGMRDERNMWWRLGALRFWKSEAFKLRRAPHPFPTYFRGSLQMTLFPDMRFRGEPFTTKEGHAAIAILFCSEKNPKGTFATFALDEDEASRIINFMNAELDETRNAGIREIPRQRRRPRRRRLTAGPQPRRDVSPARRSPRRPRAVTQHVSHSTSTAR
jgi:hypothetical protein